jgi:hypothetical protein
LTDKITQAQFCYAHEYQKGDLRIIDDRASLHKAGFDYDHSNIGAYIGCLCVATVPAERRAPGPHANKGAAVP